MLKEMTKDTPIDYDIVNRKIHESGVADLGNATIREMVKLVNEIENATGEKFIRMEMGVPGLDPVDVGIEAEIQALRRGVASQYPMIDGVTELKKEFATFMKLFADIELQPEHCIPTVGSMQGGFAAFMLVSKCRKKQNTTLIFDPCFPVQKQQHRALGIPYVSFDVYNYRGKKLYDKLESYLKQGNISSILYSNPNNPAWICMTDEELRIIAELATKYNAVVIEDLAYFAMDFRSDMSQPGQAPYQPTIAKYTDYYILLVSSSKAFSYAGQRIGMMGVSKKLFESAFPDLYENFRSELFGYALIYRGIYSLSSGTSHSAQYAFAAMLRQANEGKLNFVETVREYEKRAKVMKKLLTRNGFYIVYDSDGEKPLADGFYFTFAYPGIPGNILLTKLLYYGISSISLIITGSERTEGLRACVSQTTIEQMGLLEERLKKFHADHPIT